MHASVHTHHYNECGYRPCPACQLRLIASDARRCKRCRRAARDLRRRRVMGSALAGFAICMSLGLGLANRFGLHQHRWAFALLAALAIFCLGAWGWTRADMPRYLRRIGRLLVNPRRLTRMLRRVPMRAWSAMTAPSWRVPGSDEDTHMEPNPVDEARAEKLRAEAAKLREERALIRAQTVWFPVVVVAGIFLAAVALVKFLL